MRVIYIDDSFFRSTPFAQAMLARLKLQLQQLRPWLILISTSGKSEALEAFCAQAQATCEVIATPCRFHSGDISGVLRRDAVVIDGEGMHRCYSGSLFCYDSENREAWRIYLDLFIEKRSDALARLTRQIEEFPNEALSEKKHIFH